MAQKTPRMTKREWRSVLFGDDLPAESGVAFDQLRAIVSDRDELVVDDAALLGAIAGVAERAPAHEER